MTALLILSEPPHGSDRPYHALRLAGALQAAGHHVRIFLMSDAVWTGVAGQSGANEDTNLAGRLSALLESGAEVKACGLCVETRGAQGAAMVAGIQSAGLPDLVEWVALSDRVLTF
ncbi:MAG: DsrE family protein [Fimbriimonadaceae bacterium]